MVSSLTWALLTIIRVTLCSVHARLPQWRAVREEKDGRRVRDVERLYLGVYIAYSGSYFANSNYGNTKEKHNTCVWVILRVCSSPVWVAVQRLTAARDRVFCTAPGIQHLHRKQWKIKAVYAHVLCVHTFQKEKSILKHTLYLKTLGAWLCWQCING